MWETLKKEMVVRVPEDSRSKSLCPRRVGRTMGRGDVSRAGATGRAGNTTGLCHELRSAAEGGYSRSRDHGGDTGSVRSL